MKKIVVLLFAFCISTIISAQSVVEKAFGFSLDVPNSWSKEAKTEGTDRIHDFSDPTQNIFIEIRAFKAETAINPDLIAEVFESQYLSTAQRIAYDDYSLNNTTGKFAGYTMTVNGLNVGIGAFYATINGMGYVLWSMIETKNYSQYSAQGDAVLNTFTTFPPRTANSGFVSHPIFEITNMKLGKHLTGNYDILPQDESNSFESDIEKIFVIWDWEGHAPGKTMTIHWYFKSDEIKEAQQQYTLPDAKQGYGYANIVKPSEDFRAGEYRVQINFQGQRQKSLSFKVTKKAKPASNQNAGFVIKPPSGNGKNIKPPQQDHAKTTNNGFQFIENSVHFGEDLQSGSKTKLTKPTLVFHPTTKEIIAVFKWKGNGSGRQLKCEWFYLNTNTKKKMTITTGTYDLPNQMGGGSNFVLSKPNNGWPIGDYNLSLYLDDKYLTTDAFFVKDNTNTKTSSKSSSENTNWEKATGGSAKSSSKTSASSPNVKKVVLVSDRQHGYYTFKTGKIHGVWKEADIKLEPWCTEDAGVCGNWVVTNETDMDAVTSPPSSGYISDKAGFEDCQMMPKNKVVVVKLTDGTYAKIKIIDTKLEKVDNSQNPCQQTVTMLVQYPF